LKVQISVSRAHGERTQRKETKRICLQCLGFDGPDPRRDRMDCGRGIENADRWSGLVCLKSSNEIEAVNAGHLYEVVDIREMKT